MELINLPTVNLMSRRPDPSSISPTARGFTLLEIIIVVSIIAVMATLIVPRLAGNDKRAFKLSVDRVGDFLTMYAQRQTLGQKVVGIGHDRTSNSIMLMEIDADSGSIGNWRIDPNVQPVYFPEFMRESDIDIIVEGDRYDATQWPLSCDIGQERPTIEISLQGANETAQLTLYPYGVSPVMAASYGSVGTVRTKIDLDSTGQGRTDW